MTIYKISVVLSVSEVRSLSNKLFFLNKQKEHNSQTWESMTSNREAEKYLLFLPWNPSRVILSPCTSQSILLSTNYQSVKAASVPEVAAEQDKGTALKPEIGPIILGIVSKHRVLIYSTINPQLQEKSNCCSWAWPLVIRADQHTSHFTSEYSHPCLQN